MGSNLGGEKSMMTTTRGAAALVAACLVAGLTSAPAQNATGAGSGAEAMITLPAGHP
jgi:uncharacterized membrane protein